MTPVARLLLIQDFNPHLSLDFPYSSILHSLKTLPQLSSGFSDPAAVSEWVECLNSILQ